MNEDINIEQVVSDIPGLVSDNTAEQTPATEDTTTSDASQTTETTETTNTSGTAANESDQKQTDNTATQDPNQLTRSAAAFARLRTENANKQKLIKDMAQALGIAANNLDDNQLIEQAKNKIIELQSKERGIPEDFLKEFNELKEQQRINMEANKRTVIAQDLADIKSRFNVSDKDMRTFVDNLIRDGANPFVKDVNLRYEYINRNFDTIINQAVERGRLEEQQRAAKVAQSASSPNGKTGNNAGSSKPINSIQALNEILDTL